MGIQRGRGWGEARHGGEIYLYLYLFTVYSAGKYVFYIQGTGSRRGNTGGLIVVNKEIRDGI